MNFSLDLNCLQGAENASTMRVTHSCGMKLVALLVSKFNMETQTKILRYSAKFTKFVNAGTAKPEKLKDAERRFNVICSTIEL